MNAISTAGQSVQPRPQSQVEAQQEALDSSVSRLLGTADQIVARLQRASRQQPPQGTDNIKEVEPGMCAVASCINESRKQVDKACATLADALGRLEL